MKPCLLDTGFLVELWDLVVLQLVRGSVGLIVGPDAGNVKHWLWRFGGENNS